MFVLLLLHALFEGIMEMPSMVRAHLRDSVASDRDEVLFRVPCVWPRLRKLHLVTSLHVEWQSAGGLWFLHLEFNLSVSCRHYQDLHTVIHDKPSFGMHGLNFVWETLETVDVTIGPGTVYLHRGGGASTS
jgi:hypothetical protein